MDPENGNMNSSDDAGEGVATETPRANDRAAAAAEEYSGLCERMRGEPHTIELLTEAAELAFESGDPEAAHAHYQEALDLEPFNGRVRQSIRRRFKQSDRSQFRNIERPAPVWDDLVALVTYPFARGPVYPAVPAGVLFVLSFLPFGMSVGGFLLFLWGYQVMGSAVRGDDQPPMWHRALGDPIREIYLPLGAAIAVVIEYGAAFAALGGLGMFIEGKSDISVASYIAHSPFMIVFIALFALTCLPAVVTLIAFRENPFTALLPQNVFRTGMALGSEYLLTLFLLLAMAFPVAIISILIGGVPVLGNLVGAVALAVTVPIGGFMMGKLLARNEHKLTRLR